MLCPVCREEMLVLEFERVEIDRCPECGGVWLDSGELELVGGRAGVVEEKLLRALDEEGGERVGLAQRRRCPVCRRRLRRVRVDGENPIVLDKCPLQHGIWFDRGELQAVIRAAGARSDNVLARFLRRLDSGPQDRPAATEKGGA